MPKYSDDPQHLEASGTLKTPPEKGPARSTSGEWTEPETRPMGEDKPDGSAGSVANVGKGAGQIGKKGGRTKVW